jgi:hypothetical protein
MIRKLRIFNNKSMHMLILALALLTVAATQEQQASAGRTAFDEGYADGREARLNGGSSQAFCDPNNSSPNPDAYCALYKSGYFAGWNAAGLLYGDQQNNNNNNNNDDNDN